MDIAKNIKRLREERGLMQKEVANTVGIHPSNYSKMEKGEREFGIDVIDTDINMTKDKVLVVIYDLTLNPDLTKDKNDNWIKKVILIKYLTLAQLKQYTVDYIKQTRQLQRYSSVEVQAFEFQALVDVQKLNLKVQTAYITDHTTN